MQLRRTVLFSLLLLAIYGVSIAHAATCTLAPSGGDFTTLQDAVNLCRAVNDTSVLINVQAGEYPVAFLVIPSDVQQISIVGVPNNSSQAVLQGASWFVDPTYWYPSLSFEWLTIDMGLSNESLFVPPLANNNVTFTHCNFTNFEGNYTIMQESCTDNTTFNFTQNTFWRVKGGAFKLQGLHNIFIENNTFAFSGDNVTEAFMYLKPNWVTTGEFVFVQNHHWRLWDCREPRCRYAQSNTSYEVRCNSYDGGKTQALECFDRQRTAEIGRCPIGDFVVHDDITNNTFTITNDYLLFCRVWAPCPCQEVSFRNTTSNQIVSFAIGDIVYRTIPTPTASGGQPPDGHSGPTVLTRYTCIPGPGEVPIPITPDLVFLGPTFPSFGDPGFTLSDVLTPINSTFQYFSLGVINGSCDYPCPVLDPSTGRDPETTPCEWMIEESNATWCDEGAAECCADYLFENDVFDIIYKTNCSLRQDFFDPAIVNGSIMLVNGTKLKVHEPWYDCDFLLNCTLVPPTYVNGTLTVFGGVTGCVDERCYLNDCRINETDIYAVNSTCWNYLNLGNNVTTYQTTSVSNGQLFNVTTNSSGIITSGQMINATLGDTRFMNGSLGDVVILVGNGTITNALTAGNVLLPLVYIVDGILYWPVNTYSTLVGTDQIQGASVVNGTLQNGTLIFGGITYTQLTNPFLVFDGTGLILNATLGSGPTNVTIAVYGGKLYYSFTSYDLVTLVGGVPLTDTVISGNFTAGSFLTIGSVLANELLQNATLSSAFILSPYPDCANYSIPTSDPLCLFLRNECQDFYLGNYPAPGYVLNGTAPPDNTTIVLSPVCSFDVDGCIFVNRSGDTRCNCTTSGPTGFISMEEMLDAVIIPVTEQIECVNQTTNCSDGTMVIVTSCDYQNCSVFTNGSLSCPSFPACVAQTCADVGCNFTGLCNYSQCNTFHLLPPPKTPDFILTRLLNISEMNCTTRTFIQCDCPSVYPEDLLINYCLPFPNVTDCDPVQLTLQECLATPGCEPPPSAFNYTVDINGYPLQCLQLNNSLTCDCGRELVAQLYPPGNGSATIHIANIPDTLSNFEFIDNSACWHEDGIRLQQASYNKIANFSIHEPLWYNYQSSMRELYRQDNEYVRGTVADYAENMPRTPYRRECRDGCFNTLPAPTDERLYECFVDATADPALPAYGNTLFSTVYECLKAIEGGACRKNRTVLIKYNENPYNEPQATPYADIDTDDPTALVLLFKPVHSNFLFVSLDNAKIMGHDFRILSNVQNLTFVGINFEYAGDTGKPLFNIIRQKSHKVKGLKFYNCEFEGAGARGAGIIDTSRVSAFDMSYSNLLRWNFFAVRVLDANSTTFEYNTLIECIGRVIEFRYEAAVNMNHNTFVDTRGGANFRGVPIVFLRGTTFSKKLVCAPTDLSCLFGGTQTIRVPACTGNNTCSVTQNVLINDVTAVDYEDTFILFSGGSINITNITDNAVLKAQYGLAFVFANNINVNAQETIMLMNPLVRPSLYRSTARGIRRGADVRVVGYQLVQVNSGWNYRITTQRFCNFPCSENNYQRAFFNKTLQCIANQNWTPETMPYYGIDVPRYGYYQYHNVSDAVLYCKDFQNYPEDNRVLAYVYVNTANGSRYFRDNITVAKDTWIIGNTNDSACALPIYRPCVRGQGHTTYTYRIFLTDMCFELEEHSAGVDHWRSDPDEVLLPGDLRMDNCYFSGRSLDLDGELLVMNFILSSNVSALSQSLRKQTNKLPPQTKAYLRVTNCTAEDYLYFPDDPRVNQSLALADPDTEVVLTDEYPSGAGMRFVFRDRINTNTSAVFVNNTCKNMDGFCLQLIGAINNTVTDNLGENISCRAEGNTAALYLEGNIRYNQNLTWARALGLGQMTTVFDRNNFTQSKQCSFPVTNNKANLVDVVAYFFRAFPDGGKFCFRNNSARGTYPRDVRWTDMNQTLFATCLTYPNQVFFLDILRYLRAIANEGNCNIDPNLNPMNATKYQLEYAFAGTALELYDEVLLCDNCCFPVDPTICYVDLGNGLFVDENPWWGTYVFNSTNECINQCQAVNRVCQLLGKSDVFGFWLPGTPPFKSYTETIGVTLGPNQANQTGPVIIRGDAGMEIAGCGNYIDNPLGLTVIIEGINFRQVDNYTGCSTWLQDPSLASGHITLRSNIFNGNGSQESAVNGTFDGPLYINDNLLANYTGPHGVYVLGRVCNSSSLFSASRNSFFDFPGAALEAIGFDSNFVTYNSFVNVGGVFPGGPLHGVWISDCLGTPGSFNFDWNEFFGTPGQICAPPYTTAYYIDPAQTDVKIPWSLTENRADGESCIGLQVNNLTPFECDRPDPQFWIRRFYYPRLNTRVEGAVYDLFVGPEDAAFQSFIDADPFEVKEHLCHWCNDGCPRTTYGLLAQILIGLFFFLILCCAIVCFCCRKLCFCCPEPSYETHEDPYLKMEIPDNPNWWPVAQGENFYTPSGGFNRAQMRPTGKNPAAVAALKLPPSHKGFVPSKIPVD